MPKHILLRRLLIYCLGLFILALGTAFAVFAGLGVSPVSALPKVLSDLLPRLSMGVWTMLVFAFFILIQAAFLRRAFRVTRFLQLICSVIFGFFVDFANWLTRQLLPPPEHYVTALVYLLFSMAFVAMGVLMYLTPELLSLPAEGVSLELSRKTGKPLHQCKMIFDCCLTLAAAILSLVGFGQLAGVREGTIISALGVGKFMGVFVKLFGLRLHEFVAPLGAEDLDPDPEAGDLT